MGGCQHDINIYKFDRLTMLGSPTDWLILILVVLLVLGGSKKIPEIARSMGRAMGEFKRGQMEIEKELKNMDNKDTKTEEKQN